MSIELTPVTQADKMTLKPYSDRLHALAAGARPMLIARRLGGLADPFLRNEHDAYHELHRLHAAAESKQQEVYFVQDDDEIMGMAATIPDGRHVRLRRQPIPFVPWMMQTALLSHEVEVAGTRVVAWFGDEQATGLDPGKATHEIYGQLADGRPTWALEAVPDRNMTMGLQDAVELTPHQAVHQGLQAAGYRSEDSGYYDTGEILWAQLPQRTLYVTGQ
jgi:hypothetical protein